MNAACAASSLAANSCGSTVRRSSQGPGHKVSASPTRSSAAVGTLRGRDTAKAETAFGVGFEAGARRTILNSDFSGVRPANQHRTEPTCRYFSGFPRYSLAASLCVRHARLGAASADADVSARSTTIARKVRIATPNPYDNQPFYPAHLRISAAFASGTGAIARHNSLKAAKFPAHPGMPPTNRMPVRGTRRQMTTSPLVARCRTRVRSRFLANRVLLSTFPVESFPSPRQ
jgi:hypothetical protein